MSGEPTILADDHHARADLRMVTRAAKCFPVPLKLRQLAVHKAAKLLRSSNHRDITAGLKAVVQMEQVNTARERAVTPATQNNTQVNVYMPANTREADAPRQIVHAPIEAPAIGTVIDSVEA